LKKTKQHSHFLLTVAACSCFSFFNTQAQNLAAYTDYRGYFQAFDNGVFRQLEYLPVKSFKVGGAGIAYVDNTNELQIYSNGQKIHQTYASDLTYYVTDYLIAYKVGQVLSVFEKGETRRLSYFCKNLFVNDSIVSWFDDSNYNLNVYCNGEITSLESSMLELPRSVKSGSNILAFVNQSNYFKIFYHGEIKEVDNSAPSVFEVGRDIVAYVDGYEHYFHLFYKGETAQVEVNSPDSLKMGFGIMAYLDYSGNFRVFNNGATKKVLSNRPDFFQVKGNMIVYAYNNEFKAYYNGESKLISDFTPKEFILSNDGVAFTDENGWLKFFQKGKMFLVSSEQVNKYYVNNDVVWYEVGTNTWKIFYNGKNY
jgi:hypothetical protein